MIVSAENFREFFGQHLALSFCTHGNSQELINARELEVADDDVFFAQGFGEFAGIALWVAGEDEVGGGGQDFKAQGGHFCGQLLAGGDNRCAGLLEVGFVFYRRHCANNRQAVEGIGVEAVLDALQGFDQGRVADGVADAQAGEGARFG